MYSWARIGGATWHVQICFFSVGRAGYGAYDGDVLGNITAVVGVLGTDQIGTLEDIGHSGIPSSGARLAGSGMPWCAQSLYKADLQL